jgi:hypothetical protein
VAVQNSPPRWERKVDLIVSSDHIALLQEAGGGEIEGIQFEEYMVFLPPNHSTKDFVL